MRGFARLIVAGIALLTAFVRAADDPTGQAQLIGPKRSTSNVQLSTSNAFVIAERFVEAVNSAEPGAARRFVTDYDLPETRRLAHDILKFVARRAK